MKKAVAIKVKSNVTAGYKWAPVQHSSKKVSVKVKSSVKAGRSVNHATKKLSIKVKSSVKGGKIAANHSDLRLRSTKR